MTKSKLFELEDLISVLPASVSEAETEQIINAFGFAEKTHQDRQRESKEKYIEHDIALAVTVTKFAVDANTIMASLLHDVLLPHTGQSIEAIMTEFGEDVSNLVSALGKLAPYTDKTPPSKDDRTLEATRRAILTIVEGDSKWYARIKILKTLVEKLTEELNYNPFEELEVLGGARDQKSKKKKSKRSQ